MTTALIELSGLTKTFEGGAVTAVGGIDLTIDSGEIVALLGHNGAGKTTTLDIVLGLTEPSSGSARVLGRAPRQAVRDGRVSAVLQTGGLLADLKVGETVELIASTLAHPASTEEVMERAGITGIAGRRVSKCSGGEQQRLRFALALLADPDLLILDEPTAGMDVSARREFWAAMHLEADQGRTVVFATHYLEEAQDFADRIVVMAAGRIVADGPTDVIRAQASGRTLKARLTQDVAEQAVRSVAAIEGVTGVEFDGDLLQARGSASDAAALLLLRDFGAQDLEITAASLEDAYLSLTEPTPPAARTDASPAATTDMETQS